MQTARFYNTLSRQVETFTPLDPDHVRMYVCGPTVYDHIHVGNARSIVVFDMVFRWLRALFPRVTCVRNITDVDDKILDRARLLGTDPHALTVQTTADLFRDLEPLNVLEPTHQPRATAWISEMVAMIRGLLEHGHAYEAERHVLFHVPSDPAYGSLSGCDEAGMLAGARVEVAGFKKHPHDFVLWKPSEPGQTGWESPWGYGRPGWHIECSAMGRGLLGERFDLHGGGIDLKFPHHENEMAQSRCAHGGALMAHTWLHHGMITMTGQKMSKSEGKLVRLNEALASYPGLVLRMWFLGTHYRQPLDWSPALLESARSSLDRLLRALRPYADALHKPEDSMAWGGLDHPEHAPLRDALACDLNTPLALHHMHQLASRLNGMSAASPEGRAVASTLWTWGHGVGIFPADVEAWFQGQDQGYDGAGIADLVRQRDEARARRDFRTADTLRDQLQQKGIVLEDTPAGTRWHRAGGEGA